MGLSDRKGQTITGVPFIRRQSVLFRGRREDMMYFLFLSDRLLINCVTKNIEYEIKY